MNTMGHSTLAHNFAKMVSEEMTVQVVVSKCVPMFLYGLDACALHKSHLSLLAFTTNRFFSNQ